MIRAARKIKGGYILELINEIETAGNDPDYTTIYKNDIESSMQLYFDELQTDAENIAQLKQSQFSYLLSKTGQRLFNNRELKSIPCLYNDYDIDKLFNIYYIYKDLVLKYSKIPSLYDYSLLINVEYNVLINWKYEKTNTKRYELYKNIADFRESYLKTKCLESNNILGTITIGNVESGWNQGGSSTQHITNNIITADALPLLQSTNKAQIAKND